jgi:hypothetical protein
MSLLFISRAGQTVKFQTILSAGEERGVTLNEKSIPDMLQLITGSCLTAMSNADGAPVVIKNCGTNATSLNSWVVPKGAGAVGTLQIFGDKVRLLQVQVDFPQIFMLAPRLGTSSTLSNKT